MMVIWGCGGAKGWATKGRGLGVVMAMHLLQLPGLACAHTPAQARPGSIGEHRLDQA